MVGRESDLSLERAATAKRVVVVGAGPGGLECARLAALRGHRVALYERERHLGGALVMAATVHPENAPFLDFLRREVARLPIEVHRGRALAPEDVRALAPDAVIVASGGRVVVPEIPGADLPHVLSGPRLRQITGPALRWLHPRRLAVAARLWMPLGERVVVVGGDLAALELAEFLARHGRRVTIAAPEGQLAPEVGRKRLTEHMDALDRLGVAVNGAVACEEIVAGGIVIRPERGASRRLAADTVVLAGTLEPDTHLYDELKGAVPEAYAVGDCTGLGLIRKAVADATRVAAAL